MARYHVRDPDELRSLIRQSKRPVPHTIRSFAAQVGVSHAFIGHLLTRKRDTVDGDLAKRIAKDLKRPLTSLFVREDYPSGHGRSSASESGEGS